MEEFGPMYSRDDLRKRLAEILQEVDEGAVVGIRSRWGKDELSLRILSDKHFMALVKAEERVIELSFERSQSAAGRLTERLQRAKDYLGRTRDMYRLTRAADFENFVTPEGIARTLRMSSPTDFENILAGKRKATYRFLRRFSSVYGFSRLWLETGEGRIFSEIESPQDPARIILSADKFRYKHFHFLLFDRAEGSPVRLLIGDGAYSWRLSSHTWYFDVDDIGNYRRDLCKLHRILEVVKARDDLTFTSSFHNDAADFESFMGEREHPARFYFKSNPEQNWGSDFLDAVSGHYFETLYQRYGDNFLGAARFVYHILNPQKISESAQSEAH